MRLGPLEIILIIVVVIFVTLIARILGPRRRPAPASRGGAGPPGRARGFLYRTGVALIIGGAVALAAVAGLFRWVLQGYLWALVIIAGGIIMVLLGRRKG
jgi:hypothetical protein